MKKFRFVKLPCLTYFERSVYTTYCYELHLII